MAKSKTLLSILIPVYNEETTISEVVKRVMAVKLPSLERELIIVNDGSSDKTLGILDTYNNSKQIKIYHHTKNKGKGAAIRTCILKAKGEILIIQDGDLELDPNDYVNILQPIIKDKKMVVYGSRFLAKPRKKLPWVTYIGNKILTFITNILYGSHLTDMATAYKAFQKKVLSNIVVESNGFEVDAEITSKILKNKHKIIEVPIKYFPRTIKEGKKLKIFDAISIIFTLLKLRFSP